MKTKRKKQGAGGWKITGRIGLFIIKIPYYIGKGVYFIIKKAKEGAKKKSVEEKRGRIGAVYSEFRVIETEMGDYTEWSEKLFKSDSKIGVILGARGSGKSALGIKILENAYAEYKKKCYAIGFREEEMPSWIKVVSDISKIGNDAFVLIDEGGILYNARDFMSNANKILSDLILIARHKNLSIVFISQNSSNLEINVLRQADFLALKPSSLLQKEFERKIIQKIYDNVDEQFKNLENEPGATYIYAGNFKGFVSNPLPSFWGIKISKSFR